MSATSERLTVPAKNNGLTKRGGSESLTFTERVDFELILTPQITQLTRVSGKLMRVII